MTNSTPTLRTLTPTLDQAYKAGRSCALKGATEDNCHYRFFATQELAVAWVQGAEDAEAEQRRKHA